ncbi:hypothetical protein ONZ45_g2538 [Pleurotus djamor]|nr:hypothetical protein ONZ45_g2538 [Pleurotus djamor]
MLPDSSVLPQDIYDIILDNLRDDKPSLKACSLVASAWRSSSQKLLHRTMVFRTNKPAPAVQDVDGIPALAQGKTSLLLDMSSHLLQYVRCLVIRGDRISGFRGGTSRRRQILVPDTSLVGVLEVLRSLMLPSLGSIELSDLIWTKANSGLQLVLLSLLGSRFIKDVSLVRCDIPSDVPWLQFLGPETRRLKLLEVTITDSPVTHRETPIDDSPVSSGSSLIQLDIGERCDRSVYQWVLHRTTGLKSGATVIQSRSWRENVTTLSLHYRDGTEGLFSLVHAFSGLTTLKFNPQNCVTAFPFYELLCIPSLEYLHILPFSSGRLTWLISSFKPPDSSSSPLTLNRAVQTKSKTVFIDTWVELGRAAAMLSRITLPEILLQVREFDATVAGIPDVEVNLTMTVSTFGVKDSPERIEYEETKKTLVGLRADMKVLRLEVC